jgi:adenosylcobinamide kinase/adenosylcobinamide-phosphate guanylyltransferase
MILIVGGAYQGKMEFAQGKYPEIAWADGENCDWEDIYRSAGVVHFHAYIQRFLQMDKEANEMSFEISSDVMAIAERLIRENPDVVIVTDEIGYGIVPVDKAEREYREVTGRICTRLASEADEVYRVICGIGTRIK